MFTSDAASIDLTPLPSFSSNTAAATSLLPTTPVTTATEKTYSAFLNG